MYKCRSDPHFGGRRATAATDDRALRSSPVTNPEGVCLYGAKDNVQFGGKDRYGGKRSEGTTIPVKGTAEMNVVTGGKMADHTSRAGFNVRHLRHGSTPRRVSGTSTDRRRLLEEAARSVDDGWAAKQRSRNSNIRAADMGRNRLWGRVGEDGAWGEATTTDDVTAIVAYGDQRAARVYRKQREESFETTTIVSHLPKSLLREIPNSYDDGRSRWTCDDATAKRYADTLSGYLAESVLTGGRDAIHAVSVHMDETVPHVHVICDTYAPDPKNEGWLRCEASQMWGQHRDVKDESGRVVSGMTKMREYQRGFRETVSGDGIEVALEPAPRSRSSMTKHEYVALQERQREVEAREAEVLPTRLRQRAADVSRREAEVAEREENVRPLEKRVATALNAIARAEERATSAERKKLEFEQKIKLLEARASEIDEQARKAQELHQAAISGWNSLEEWKQGVLDNLADREAAVTEAQASTEAREQAAKVREAGLDAREGELDAEKAGLETYARSLTERERDVKGREDGVGERERELDKRRKELDEFKEKLDEWGEELGDFATLSERFDEKVDEAVSAIAAEASNIAMGEGRYALVNVLKRTKMADGATWYDRAEQKMEKNYMRACFNATEAERKRLKDETLTWAQAEYMKKVGRERSYSGVVLDSQQTHQTEGDKDLGD